MTDGRGGYRRPTNPAPASGPGALSQRTDGGPPVAPTPEMPEPPQAQAAPPGAEMPQLPTPPKVDPVLAAASRVQILEAMYTRTPTRQLRSILEQAYYFGDGSS